MEITFEVRGNSLVHDWECRPIIYTEALLFSERDNLGLKEGDKIQVSTEEKEGWNTLHQKSTAAYGTVYTIGNSDNIVSFCNTRLSSALKGIPERIYYKVLNKEV